MWYYRGRIRIKPDWNVKIYKKMVSTNTLGIRIKPDWNVKYILKNLSILFILLE